MLGLYERLLETLAERLPPPALNSTDPATFAIDTALAILSCQPQICAALIADGFTLPEATELWRDGLARVQERVSSKPVENFRAVSANDIEVKLSFSDWLRAVNGHYISVGEGPFIQGSIERQGRFFLFARPLDRAIKYLTPAEQETHEHYRIVIWRSSRGRHGRTHKISPCGSV